MRKCSECGKSFKEKNSLKHHEKSHKEEPTIKINKESNLKIYAIIGISLAVILYFIFIPNNIQTVPEQEKSPEEDVIDYYLQSHSQIPNGLHVHPFIEIIINGEKQIIPANIGIDENGMKVIHTHDSTGKIHVEPPKPAKLTLGGFFRVWDQKFTSNCIFDYCTDEENKLKVFVDGKETEEFENLRLDTRDGEKILIVYGKDL